MESIHIETTRRELPHPTVIDMLKLFCMGIKVEWHVIWKVFEFFIKNCNIFHVISNKSEKSYIEKNTLLRYVYNSESKTYFAHNVISDYRFLSCILKNNICYWATATSYFFLYIYFRSSLLLVKLVIYHNHPQEKNQ